EELATSGEMAPRALPAQASGDDTRSLPMLALVLGHFPTRRRLLAREKALLQR
ncbi:MAG: hypothetical protein ACI9OU_000462, partial [Candidatus Promineifilaceae bacterium]